VARSDTVGPEHTLNAAALSGSSIDDPASTAGLSRRTGFWIEGDRPIEGHAHHWAGDQADRRRRS
jgi:hypothetical protein